MENKIKVLCIYRKNNGSDFHKLVYPLSKINGQSVGDRVIEVTFKEFSDDLFNQIFDYDILIYNWNINYTTQQLGEIQAKGVKILYVIDDSFEISENNGNYLDSLDRDFAKSRVKQQLLIADAVVTTNGALTLQAMNYSDHIGVLPNFLDPSDFKSTKEESEKLRVGIVGSSSHIENFVLLKGALGRIAKNKELVENCEFVLCGNDNQPGWKYVIDMFKKKKNLNVTVRDFKPTEEYFDLYSNLDVCLMPLVGSEFNACRSALKLNECAIANVLPVGSSLYTLKELNAIIKADTPLEYEQALIKCLDKEYYNETLEKITKENLEKADYKTRFENTKSIINTVYSDDLKVNIENLKLYSIKYNENQVAEYESVFNTNKETPWRFEYQVFLDKLNEVKESKEDFYGFLSWKFLSKTGLAKQILYKSLYKKDYNSYDFINISKRHWKTTKDYFEFSNKQHPKLDVLLKRLLNHLNKDFKYNKNNYTYSNFFIMRKEYLVDYIENWIVPALKFMENDKEYFEDPSYIGVGKEKLKELTGLDNYGYITFVLERLINIYIEDKKLKVLNII